jgi:hypothetical protein
MQVLFLIFWGTFILISILARLSYICIAGCKGFFYCAAPSSYQHLLLFVFWMVAILTRMRQILNLDFIFISLMTKKLHIFCVFHGQCIASFEMCLFSSFDHLLIICFWHLHQKLDGCGYLSLFLDIQFYSFGLCVCFCASTIVLVLVYPGSMVWSEVLLHIHPCSFSLFTDNMILLLKDLKDFRKLLDLINIFSKA